MITDDEIEIDFNPLQANADSSIRSNCDSVSNGTNSNCSRQEKPNLLKILTDDEIGIDFDPIEANADSSIRYNCDSVSNVTDSSCSQ
jgi:hypothetical protein